MEIYAICNGSVAAFNQQLKDSLDNQDDNYFALQVIFDPKLVEFGSNDFTKFVLYQSRIDAIQAMIPHKIITVVDDTKGRIPYLLFKVILNDKIVGQVVQMVLQGGKYEFSKNIPINADMLTDSEFPKFLEEEHLVINSLVCSYSRAPNCP